MKRLRVPFPIPRKSKQPVSLLLRNRKQVRSNFLLFLFVAVILTYGIQVQVFAPIPTRSFLLHQRATLHQSTVKPDFGRTELESPIFQNSRYITDHAVTEEDELLSAQLQKIREFQNWPVLGNPESTAPNMYYDSNTNQILTTEANIAFFLQISQGNVNVAPRLLSRIWHPSNVYCIHFDTKIPLRQADMFISAIKSNPKLSNVLILPSVPVTYAGISMLLNTLESMNALLTVSQGWDYYINLSGSDYPLVSATAMRRLLGRADVLHSRTSFIDYSRGPEYWASVLAYRFGHLYFDHSLGFDHKSNRKIDETSLAHPVYKLKNLRIQIPKGEAWVIAHRTLCEKAVYGNAARRLIALFSNMRSTPEHFFQTLAWNDKTLNNTIVPDAFRQVFWGTKNDQSDGHPAYVDRISNGTYDLWPDISYSAGFFARKFRIPNSSLMEHIDIQKSGIADREANKTAVAKSFGIVERRLSCLMRIRASSPDERLDHGKICYRKGWQISGCNEEGQELCIGTFAEPTP